MLAGRSTLIAVAAAALLIPAALAPAAHAGTQMREFKAFGITWSGPGPTRPESATWPSTSSSDKRAGGKYTPRRLTRVRFSKLPLRCHEPGSPSTTTAPLTADFATDVMLTKPQTPKPEAQPLRLPLLLGLRRLRDRVRVLRRNDRQGQRQGLAPRARQVRDPSLRLSRRPVRPTAPRAARWLVGSPTQCKRPGQSGDLPLCRFD